MNTILCEKTIYLTDKPRARLIDALRSALNSAEGGSDEVSIVYGDIEVTFNLKDNEFVVYG